MNQNTYSVSTARTHVAVQNKVLRNTYALLAMLFTAGAGTAWLAQAMHWRIGFLPFLVGIFAFSWAINRTRNSAWGIAVAFAFAAFLGLFTGANVDYYLYAYGNGAELVTTAFGLTAFVFFGLSAYASTTKRDFTGWGPFIMVGWLVVLGAILAYLVAAWLFGIQLTAFSLAITSMGILLASAGIVWKTQLIVRHGETNYILAATSLLADIFVLFNNLLHLLGFGFGDD